MSWRFLLPTWVGDIVLCIHISYLRLVLGDEQIEDPG